ncbi:Protein S-acyltransferase protein [Dioscorea alata]|uniref:Protein S-acyltransferase protein n=1 Tax=Dioscorea alata TaxID=55571 RepID=A0ACB7U0K0_DIOAL|nr:Protein S-acyltransferase protein [Dioscorea alata]
MCAAPHTAKLSESKRNVIETDGSAKFVYQVWKGNNRFLLGGRLIFGPDVRSMVLTVFLIVIPMILFTVFVSQRLINEFPHHHGYLIMAIGVVFTIYVLFLLVFTSARDPGIIPHNAHPPEPDNDTESELVGNQRGSLSLPPTKDVLVNGITVKVKYCHTCMLYRPPRCSHCSICNNCVERFDHHCPWVGQCIGKRNYRFFFMFVSSTTLLCLYVFAFCCVNLKKIMDANECSLWRAILRSPFSAILILYTFVAAWFVGGLTAFHLYLISTNQTTYENFRYRYDKKTNPYNQGWMRNFMETFFSEIPSSKNDFRATVKNNSTPFSSLPPGQVSSPPKTSVDLETGGKRHAVAEEELEDIQSEIGSMRVSEGCDPQPSHLIITESKTNREQATQDDIQIQALTAEINTENEKITKS